MHFKKTKINKFDLANLIYCCVLCSMMFMNTIHATAEEAAEAECQHDWVTKIQTASCTEDGYVHAICADCKEEIEANLPSSGHDISLDDLKELKEDYELYRKAKLERPEWHLTNAVYGTCKTCEHVLVWESTSSFLGIDTENSNDFLDASEIDEENYLNREEIKNGQIGID